MATLESLFGLDVSRRVVQPRGAVCLPTEMRLLLRVSLIACIAIIAMGAQCRRPANRGRPASMPTAQATFSVELRDAIASADLARVNRLLDSGLSPNTPMDGKSFDPPLVGAIVDDNEGIFTLLVERGADVNGSNKYGLTPLHTAALIGNSRAVLWLCAAGANVNATAADYGRMTPLHIAALQNQIEVARRLLEAGADPNLKDIEGKTPLHFAAQYADLAMVRLLLTHNSDLTQRDAKGLSALEMARREGKSDIVALLAPGPTSQATTEPGH
jgi:ankyrin repeat protein